MTSSPRRTDLFKSTVTHKFEILPGGEVRRDAPLRAVPLHLEHPLPLAVRIVPLQQQLFAVVYYLTVRAVRPRQVPRRTSDLLLLEDQRLARLRVLRGLHLPMASFYWKRTLRLVIDLGHTVN